MEFVIAAGIFAGLGAIVIAVIAIFRNIVNNNKPEDTDKPK
jgi:hypothetical protein